MACTTLLEQHRGSDYRAGKTQRTNTEILTTELIKDPMTNTEVLTTGLVKPSGTNTQILNTRIAQSRGD
jgi:hypothetical protein